MSKIPPHSGKDSVKAFLADGYRIDHETGDHVIMWGDGLIRPLVIPQYPELPNFVISNNLRTAGMTRERYIELLRGKKPAKKKTKPTDKKKKRRK